MLGFVKNSTHKFEIEMRDRVVSVSEEMIQKLFKENTQLKMRLHAQVLQNARLERRLAPFTKIRNRDSRGRFIKDTVA